MSKRPGKKKRRNVFAFAVVLLSVVNLALAIFLLFYTQDVDIKGDTYCTKKEIVKEIQKDPLSINTLYVMAKYKLGKGTYPKCLDRMEVSLKNPWTLKIVVHEKKMIGYTQSSDGQYVYFDDEGMVLKICDSAIEGIVLVDGIEIDEVKRYQKIEGNATLFDKVNEIITDTAKSELELKKIIYRDGKIYMELTNKIYVSFGEKVTSDKISLVPTLIKKLGNQSGMLHMETYEESKDTVTFMKDESIE